MFFKKKAAVFFKNAEAFCLKRPDVFLKRLGVSERISFCDEILLFCLV